MNKISMESITETFFEKKIILETSDIYSTALEIKEIISAFGNTAERKNTFETDGPRKRVSMSFEVAKPIDRISGAKITVTINGESGTTGLLSIWISGEFTSFLRFSSGFVSNTFYEYYRDSIFPVIKSDAEIEMKRIWHQIDAKINEKFAHSKSTN